MEHVTRALAVALSSVVLGGSLFADVTTEKLTFTGSTTPGTTSIIYLNGTYNFTYVGDESLIYQLNVADPKVAGGQITIKEAISDSYPINGGGFIYRDPSSNFWFPPDTYPKTTLVGHSVAGNTVTLDYVLNFNGLHPIRYQITQDQKVLRIRVFDPQNNVNVANNFSGIYFNNTTGVENPIPIRMQGALGQPLVMFRNGSLHYFTANMLDMFQSNAQDYQILNMGNPEKGPDWIKLNFSSVVQYKPLSNNKLAGPLDDTFVIVVSGKIKDVLVTSTAPNSPYHGVLSNRMFFDGPENHWSYYSGMFDLYESLGMYNLAGYFFNWSNSAKDAPAPQNVGPDWSPAYDTNNFQTMLAKGVGKGALLSGYTAFNCVPPTAPSTAINPAEYVRDAAGNVKNYVQLGFPLLAVEASGTRAIAENTLLKAKGANAAYLDIHTYGSLSKGPDGDHVDQQASSPWSKTLRQAYAAQKNWVDGMRATLNGPLMGEGSIATANTNMEWLWYGYVDSVQRCINSGVGLHSNQMPVGSKDTPLAWPIIPEYEWRVAANRQVNHGNGFYDRFFSKNEGSAIVNMTTGDPLYPLSQDARDLYQALLLAYGHAGYVITNGTQSSTEGYLTHGAAADTYFMTNALQTLYFNSPVTSIRYWYLGMWRTFEGVIFKTETTDTFRKIPVLVTFNNGLLLYVNNSDSSLPITDGGVTYTLPARTGWYASCPNFLKAFSAIPPTTGGKRIDYCYAAGQYEYFNGRGAVSGYGGLTTAAKRIVYSVFPSNLTVTESSAGVLQPVAGTPPALTSIKLYSDSASPAKGSRMGMRAIGFYANNSARDLTTLVKWSSSNTTVGQVNSSGVFAAGANGSTTISATAYGGVMPTPIAISVN